MSRKTKEKSLILDDRMVMLCPECSDEHTHLLECLYDNEDDGRLSCTLLFFCECGNHKFSHRFWQHEGSTTVETQCHDMDAGELKEHGMGGHLRAIDEDDDEDDDEDEEDEEGEDVDDDYDPHVSCSAWPDCDLNPNGCGLSPGGDTEHFGHKD